MAKKYTHSLHILLYDGNFFQKRLKRGKNEADSVVERNIELGRLHDSVVERNIELCPYFI